MKQYTHTVYLTPASTIVAKSAGYVFEEWLRQLKGFSKVIGLENEAKATLDSGNVLLSPNALAFLPNHPSDPMHTIYEALLIAEQLKKIGGKIIDFDPNYMVVGVRDVFSLDALGIGVRLQSSLYGGGNFSYDGSFLGLGTDEAIKKHGSAPLTNNNNNNNRVVAKGFETLEDLVEKVKSLVSEPKPIHS